MAGGRGARLLLLAGVAAAFGLLQLRWGQLDGGCGGDAAPQYAFARRHSFPTTKNEIHKFLDANPKLDVQERDDLLMKLTEVYKKEMVKEGRRFKWENALTYFRQMEERGCDADAECFTAAIRACGEKLKRWQEAFAIFEQMRERRLRPTVDTANWLMSACNNARQDKRALDAFDHLRRFGIRPTNVTLGRALTSCRTGLWADALAFLEELAEEKIPRKTEHFTMAAEACDAAGEFEVLEELEEWAASEGVDVEYVGS